MHKSITSVLSAAVFAAAITGSALTASAASNGFTIPVPTAKPLVTFEIAQAESDAEGDSSSNSTGPGQTTNAIDEEQQPMETMDSMGTSSISGDLVISGVSDYAVIDVTKISVKRVSELPQKNVRDGYAKLDAANQAEVQKLQADIMTNPELVSALEAQSVQVNNIVSAQQNADGTVTFIVL